MKVNVLIQEIKKGYYDVEDGFVKLDKKMVLELLKELHRRRRVMSIPNEVLVLKHKEKANARD